MHGNCVPPKFKYINMLLLLQLRSTRRHTMRSKNGMNERTESYSSFLFSYFKSCTQGNCVSDSSVPSTCIYGDDLTSSGDIYNIIRYPRLFVQCSTAISLMQSSNVDPVFFCRYTFLSFMSACCKTCERKSIRRFKIPCQYQNEMSY